MTKSFFTFKSSSSNTGHYLEVIGPANVAKTIVIRKFVPEEEILEQHTEADFDSSSCPKGRLGDIIDVNDHVLIGACTIGEEETNPDNQN